MIHKIAKPVLVLLTLFVLGGTIYFLIKYSGKRLPENHMCNKIKDLAVRGQCIDWALSNEN